MAAARGHDAIARTLRAIALSRTPGFNFPGHFLELAFERVARSGSRLVLDTGPHNADADGQMDMGPFALLADIALATSFRGAVGKGSRVATVSMGLQLTGAPRVGRLVATASFDGFLAQGRERQGHARVAVHSARTLVATGEGSFMVLGLPNATAPHPLPRAGWKHDEAAVEAELSASEAEVLAHARQSMRAGAGAFIQRFWGYAPRKTAKGATCTTWNGPHVGNRVGHAQGGFTFGLATTTASAALPAAWHLASANAWYIGPGLGKKLIAKSTIVHRGLSTAVVHTRLEDEDQRGVLECMTSHTHGRRD